jgi:hypothetical protein
MDHTGEVGVGDFDESAELLNADDFSLENFIDES